MTTCAKGWRHVYFNENTVRYWGGHVLAIAGIAVLGWSWLGLALALALYVPRGFFIEGVHHRYFSHRSYKTSRWFQLVLAICTQGTAVQRGVLGWAANHNLHHKLSDQPGDPHSPRSGIWWAHLGWVVMPDDFEGYGTDRACIKHFTRFPELRWLDRWWWTPVVAVAAALFVAGGWFALVWGFAVSTVLSWHGTFAVNSLGHLWGTRRYATGDDSRNNPVLALITMGGGWHNNHHHYPVAARAGFYWWEIDCTYYVLRALAAVGLIWDLRDVPDHIRKQWRGDDRAALALK
jgi:stearoyl-CoA desaturase (delta-9 desaturase)